MITEKTLEEIRNNHNTGIEHEIALFRCLLQKDIDIHKVDCAIQSRTDAQLIISIIETTSIREIMEELSARVLSLEDVSLETQNDDIGPSDIVMVLKTASGATEKIGLSVKNANTCTLNATGRKFLSEQQIVNLKSKLPMFTDEYISEMTCSYGSVENWFRKRKPSTTTDKYIDLIRDEVIVNWSRKSNAERRGILMEAYQETSPIPYWVFTYTSSSQTLNTNPYKIALSDVPKVKVKKYETSYVGFYLHNRLIGKMQVKFNNGFVERCKKSCPDRIVEGVAMSFGQPFTSWNFSLV